MSRDDETPSVNPEDNADQGAGWDVNPESSRPDRSSGDDGYQRGGGVDRGDGGVAPQRYRPTNHPEDAPGGFNPEHGAPGGTGQTDAPRASGGISSSGYQPYPGSAAGDGQSYQNFQHYQGYSAYGNSPGGYGGTDQGGVAPETTDGKVNIMRAVRFGFRTVFSNPGIWILGTVIVGLLFMVISLLLGFLLMAFDPAGMVDADPLAPVNIILNVVITVLAWAVAIGVMRGALIETDGRRAKLSDFFHPINVGQTVILMVILTVVGLVVSTLLQLDTQEMVLINEATGEISVDESGLARISLIMVAAVLVNPLYTYWTYYTADGRENAVGAATHGFFDALRNYPKLLLYSIIAGVAIIVVGLITLLLGFIVLLPASALITAHLYRQMSGGNVPVEQRR